jgi:GNAT superfamily N-acetyltransferase
MEMEYRRATDADLMLLTLMNRQLIEDEGHSNPMNDAQLAQRMRGWLKGEYKCVIFENEGEPLAYAIYRRDPGLIYLRQFFVARPHRRRGIGRRAMEILMNEIWPSDDRIVVEVLCCNTAGHAFWRAMGFADTSVTMERRPR